MGACLRGGGFELNPPYTHTYLLYLAKIRNPCAAPAPPLSPPVMGCGASSLPASKYADARPEPPQNEAPADTSPIMATTKVEAAKLKADYAAAVKAPPKGSRQWDAFISFDASSAKDLGDKIRTTLLGASYKVPTARRGDVTAQLQGVRDAARVILLLTPSYFDNPTCCAEFCEAVHRGIAIVPVCVEGSTWQGMPFPQLSDVPESVLLAELGQEVYPRAALGRARRWPSFLP